MHDAGTAVGLNATALKCQKLLKWRYKISEYNAVYNVGYLYCVYFIMCCNGVIDDYDDNI